MSTRLFSFAASTVAVTLLLSSGCADALGLPKDLRVGNDTAQATPQAQPRATTGGRRQASTTPSARSTAAGPGQAHRVSLDFGSANRSTPSARHALPTPSFASGHDTALAAAAGSHHTIDGWGARSSAFVAGLGLFTHLALGHAPGHGVDGPYTATSSTADALALPEPSDWAKLLAGLVVVGSLAMRRRPHA